MLKGKLASAGGLKAFRARAGHSNGYALHALELAVLKVTLPSNPVVGIAGTQSCQPQTSMTIPTCWHMSQAVVDIMACASE